MSTLNVRKHVHEIRMNINHRFNVQWKKVNTILYFHKVDLKLLGKKLVLPIKEVMCCV